MSEYSAHAATILMTRCLEPEGRTWLQQAFERHVREGISMDDALGLKTPGNRPNVPEQHALTRRNQYLRRAMKEFQMLHPAKWRDKDFQEYALNFKKKEWQKLKGLDEPPGYVTLLHQHLFWVYWYARRAGREPVPSSVSGLSEALRQVGQPSEQNVSGDD